MSGHFQCTATGAGQSADERYLDIVLKRFARRDVHADVVAVDLGDDGVEALPDPEQAQKA